MGGQDWVDGQSLGGENRAAKAEVQEEGGGGAGARDTEHNCAGSRRSQWCKLAPWNSPRCPISSASCNQLVLGAGAFDRCFTEDGFIGHFSTKTEIAL